VSLPPSLSIHPDALLTRAATAAALTDAGYPVAPATLETKATRGGGPPFRKFGQRVLYRWGDALEWAQSKLSSLVSSTAELDRVGHPAGHRRTLQGQRGVGERAATAMTAAGIAAAPDAAIRVEASRSSKSPRALRLSNRFLAPRSLR
jgi:hypothetical protein